MKMKQDRNEGIGTTVLKPIVAGHKRTQGIIKNVFKRVTESIWACEYQRGFYLLSDLAFL